MAGIRVTNIAAHSKQRETKGRQKKDPPCTERVVPWKPSGRLRQTWPAHLVGNTVGFDTTEWCRRSTVKAHPLVK